MQLCIKHLSKKLLLSKYNKTIVKQQNSKQIDEYMYAITVQFNNEKKNIKITTH